MECVCLTVNSSEISCRSLQVVNNIIYFIYFHLCTPFPHWSFLSLFLLILFFQFFYYSLFLVCVCACVCDSAGGCHCDKCMLTGCSSFTEQPEQTLPAPHRLLYSSLLFFFFFTFLQYYSICFIFSFSFDKLYSPLNFNYMMLMYSFFYHFTVYRFHVYLEDHKNLDFINL